MCVRCACDEVGYVDVRECCAFGGVVVCVCLGLDFWVGWVVGCVCVGVGWCDEVGVVVVRVECGDLGVVRVCGGEDYCYVVCFCYAVVCV